MDGYLMKKNIIGCEEWINLPELSIPAIKARVDSGAKTSSLHAVNIKPFNFENNIWVSFEVHPIQNNRKVVVHCKAPVVDKRNIRSSSGHSEKRYVVKTSTRIGQDQWEIELTLTNRDSMGYRMLLGREAMKGRLLVDPEKRFCQGALDEANLAELYSNSRVQVSGLKIALLASNPNLYSNRRIMEAGQQRGHEMIFLDIKKCYMKLEAMLPEVHYHGGEVLGDIDAVIPRIRPAITFYGCALVRQFESLGAYCLNSAEAIAQSRDKLRSLQLMLSQGIDIPLSGFANSPDNTEDLITMVGGAPLIVKLLEGTQGKGVVLAETRKAAESVINAFKSLKANILVQEFIKEAQGRDIRCFVVDNKVIAAYQRISAPGEFRANMHLGGSAAKIKITPMERKLAIRAAKVTGLKVSGVDIIRSVDGPRVLEVNSSPGLEGIEGITGMDIAGEMIRFIEKQIGWKSSI